MDTFFIWSVQSKYERATVVTTFTSIFFPLLNTWGENTVLFAYNFWHNLQLGWKYLQIAQNVTFGHIYIHMCMHPVKSHCEYKDWTHFWVHEPVLVHYKSLVTLLDFSKSIFQSLSFSKPPHSMRWPSSRAVNGFRLPLRTIYRGLRKPWLILQLCMNFISSVCLMVSMSTGHTETE